MTVAQLISVAIQGSMALMVFCVALNAQRGDLLYLVRQPGLLLRSLLAMNVIMPAFAIALAVLCDLDLPLEIGLIALAVSPVPPILPGKELKAGGTGSYVVGLLAAAALVSVVFVPVVVEILGGIFDRPVNTSAAAVARIVVTSILAPLLVGIAVRKLAPAFAARIARPLSIFATVLLVAAFLPVLVRVLPAIIASVGNFTLLAIVVFVLVGLAVGHLLGGPNPGDRTVLALSTATRHPGVALAIAHDSPELGEVTAVVLLCLLVGGIASAPYVRWRKQLHTATD